MLKLARTSSLLTLFAALGVMGLLLTGSGARDSRSDSVTAAPLDRTGESRVYRSGLITLEPPRPGDMPPTSALDAFRADQQVSVWPEEAQDAEVEILYGYLTVGDYGTMVDGVLVPEIQKRPVWLVIRKDVPYSGITGGPPGGSGVVPLPTDLVSAYDPRTLELLTSFS